MVMPGQAAAPAIDFHDRRSSETSRLRNHPRRQVQESYSIWLFGDEIFSVTLQMKADHTCIVSRRKASHNCAAFNPTSKCEMIRIEVANGNVRREAIADDYKIGAAPHRS